MLHPGWSSGLKKHYYTHTVKRDISLELHSLALSINACKDDGEDKEAFISITCCCWRKLRFIKEAGITNLTRYFTVTFTQNSCDSQMCMSSNSLEITMLGLTVSCKHPHGLTRGELLISFFFKPVIPRIYLGLFSFSYRFCTCIIKAVSVLTTSDFVW